MPAENLDVALKHAQAGDELAVTCLYRALNPPLLRYLRHHVSESAEDLASEVWLAAAKALTRFVGDSQGFRAMLFAIARRRIADHFRRRSRQPATVVLEAARYLSDVVETSDVVLEELSTQQAIEALTDSLPPDQAEVVLLRVVADLSVDQVARIMGRSEGSVRVLQHRALRSLRAERERQPVTF